MTEYLREDPASKVLEIGARESVGAPTRTYTGTPEEIQRAMEADVPPGSILEVSYAIPSLLDYLPVETMAAVMFQLWVTMDGLRNGGDPDHELLFVRYDPRTHELLTQWRLKRTPPLVVLGAVTAAVAVVGWALSTTIREARVFVIEAVPVASTAAEGLGLVFLLLGAAALRQKG